MGKISRIQLRGISRTPSDRLTEDGGCAESLNVSLDHSELAPSFIPEDVTRELGLPENADGDVLLFHEGAGYAYCIVKRGQKIGVWEGEEFKPFITLEQDEIMNDASSFGNTIVVATDKNIHYVLRKTEGYKLLGTGIPMPSVSLYDAIPANKSADRINIITQTLVSNVGDPGKIAEFDTGVWNSYTQDPDGNDVNSDSDVKLWISHAWKDFVTMKNANEEKGIFSTPILAKYAIRLKTGEYIDSDPYLIGGGLVSGITGIGKATSVASQTGRKWTSTIDFTLNCCYHLAARLAYKVDEFRSQLEDWKDVISSLDIFISTDIYPAPYEYDKIEQPQAGNPNVTHPLLYAKATTERVFESGVLVGANSVIRFGNITEEDYKERLLEKSHFYLAKSYELVDEEGIINEESIAELKRGAVIDTQKIMAEDKRVVQDRLPDTYRARHKLTAQQVNAYNSHLLLSGVSSYLPSGPVGLSGKKVRDTSDPPRAWSDAIRYRFKFYVRGASESMSVNGRWLDGTTYFYNNAIITGDSFTWLTFPDRRCYKVAIEKRDSNGRVSVKTFEMKPHPFLQCAYLYIGMDTAYGTAVDGQEDVDFEEESPSELELSKVFQSNLDEPWVFPAEGRITVGNSAVVGLAVATSALSQGQFGQFPLYVFTEDGIWALETAADGSFVTSKPLSRDVCVNPDSIISIDNAVIFVTDKGVMLLQGSQVVNISPNMNGRHYTIEETAKVILEKTIEDTIAKISKTPVDQMAQVIQNEVSQSISQQETRASIERTAQSIIAEEEFFKDLLPILSDSTHFMAFVREATIAYDYPGQRLVFVKKDEKYQYVYKLDTQTWHKTAYGIGLVAPINSYPEALVQGEGEGHTKVYDLSTILDAAESRIPARAVIATRPFDLGAPDVLKTITDIKVRGQYARGAVKFLLLGSMDGINFYVIGTKRGKAWKLFRLIILADLDPTERISWVDVIYEEKFTNRLR